MIKTYIIRRFLLSPGRSMTRWENKTVTVNIGARRKIGMSGANNALAFAAFS
jgi:hypothetical protein